MHPTNRWADWTLTLDKTLSSDISFYFHLDRSAASYQKLYFKAPEQIDFKAHVSTQFDMIRPQDNAIDLTLLNVGDPSTSLPPNMNRFIYTVYWGKDESQPIWKKSWYLSDFDGCHLKIDKGIDKLHYNDDVGKPKAILTWYGD